MASGFVNPIRFVREVRAEGARVTWPGRRETLVTTGLVLVMSTLTALFFLACDQIIGFFVRAAFAGSG